MGSDRFRKVEVEYLPWLPGEPDGAEPPPRVNRIGSPTMRVPHGTVPMPPRGSLLATRGAPVKMVPIADLVWPSSIPEHIVARLGDSTRGKLSRFVKDWVLARDGHRCVRCLARAYRKPRRILTIDHIVPRSEGGVSHPWNLRTLCWGCHVLHNDGVW